MKKDLLLQFIAYLLCTLFFYAASMKAMDFGQFRVDISQSPLLANVPHLLTALFVIVTELTAAFMLAFPATRLYGFFLSSFLMLLFTVYMSVLYLFYVNIPCSCGGILGQMGYPAHIVFNACFTVLAITGTLLQQYGNDLAGQRKQRSTSEQH